MADLVAFLVVVAVVGLVYVPVMSWRLRRSAINRLQDDNPDALAMGPVGQDRWITQWLARAGYRRPQATALFVTATLVCAGVGMVGGQIYRVTMLDTLVTMVVAMPGGVGEVLGAVLGVGHWILFVLITLVPTIIVRAARRARVRAVEQDLPLVLELFATMGEAGLGFDAALTKVIRSQGAERPLIAEFVNFQFDMLAGIPRAQALRQLARRVDVASLTSFTSALVQAEEVGASLSDTLRHQANDLRLRRREDALLKAQALPVQLVFPLVICFLPGIFLSTLAPVLYQMIQVAEGVLGAGQ
ncbi:MAG: type II secretion system F family protein [Acidobacteria bacterium]|nr:type II secretion system F family protein [Acidobacteriota bacterium]